MLNTAHVPMITLVDQIDPLLLNGDKIQPGHPLFGLVWINPLRVSGTPCFYAQRLLHKLADKKRPIPRKQGLERQIYGWGPLVSCEGWFGQTHVKTGG